MKFSVFGKELEYSNGKVNYNYIHTTVGKKISKMEREFSSKYYSKFDNMDEVIKGISDFSFSYVQDVVEWGLGLFNKNEVYTYDLDRFCDEYGEDCFQFLRAALEIVEDQYMELITDQEEAEEYRRNRKAYRGRLVGGGFGIDGAIKGMATAGAVNMATGLAHSAVNVVGNIGSSISTHFSKQKLYKDEEIVNLYIRGIRETMSALVVCIALVLKENSKFEIEKSSSEKEKECNAIINNIKQGYINDKDTMLEKCLYVLMIDPYNKNTYEILRANFDDPKGELDELAQFFGIDIIKNYKEKKIIEILSGIDYFSIDNINEGQKKFESWAEAYNVDTTIYIECFDKVKNLLDETNRTVDEILYDSQELAHDVQNQIFKFMSKIKEVSGNDVVGINDLIKMLDSSTVKSKEKYITYLKDELKEEDIRFRRVKGNDYSSRDEAEKARKEAENLDRIIEKFSSYEEIQDAKSKIALIETEDLKKIYLEYLEQCEEVWNAQNSSKFIDDILKCQLRKDLAVEFYTADAFIKEGKKLNVTNDDFYKWFDDFRKSYSTINGIHYDDPEDADKAFLKWIEHSRQYLQYITEKNAPKKSLFGSIKNAATGLIYKNYEGEYNTLTENGTKPIPDDQKTDIDSIHNTTHTNYMLISEFTEDMEEKFGRVMMPYAIEEKSMDASNLYKNTPQVNGDTIKNIMSQSCSKIAISGESSTASENLMDFSDDEKVKKELKRIRIVDVSKNKAFTVDLLIKALKLDRDKAKELADSAPVVVGEPQGVVGDPLEMLYEILLEEGIEVELPEDAFE